MTTEEDFQQMLDQDPDDYETRLIFSEWLRDQDDSRADGYQLLGMLRIRAIASWPTWFAPILKDERNLGQEWFNEIVKIGRYHELRRQFESGEIVWVDYQDRRVAEDVAALAFANLPAESRAELLSQRAVAHVSNRTQRNGGIASE